MPGPPVLIVSLATTLGWRTNEAELSGSLTRLGVGHRVLRMRLGSLRLVRRTGSLPLVDAAEALACRRILARGLKRHRPRAVIFLSTTAALFAPVGQLRARGIEVGVRLDAPAAVNRPGRANALGRALERRSLSAATVLIAMGPESARATAGLCDHVATVPVPVGCPSAPGGLSRSRDVVAYAADPERKGLDLIAEAWSAASPSPSGGRLVITGTDPERARRFLRRRSVPEPSGIHWAGHLDRDSHLALVGSAAAFVSASDFEQAGIAQLEALACGTPLVTTPSGGAYEAYPIARALASELAPPERSSAALAGALRAALAMDAERRDVYAAAAREKVRPFSREVADQQLARDVLPLLLR